MLLSLVLLVALFVCGQVSAGPTPPTSRCRKWGWPGHPFGSNPWGPVLLSDNAVKAPPIHCSHSSTAPLPTQSPSIPQSANRSTSVPISTAVALIPLGDDDDASPTSTSSRATTTATSPNSRPSSPPANNSGDEEADDDDDNEDDPNRTHADVKASPTTTTTSRTSSRSRSRSTTRPPAPPSPTPRPPAPKPDPPAQVAPAPPANQSSGGDIGTYLQRHNSVRAQHGAAPLSWSDNLASKAQEWANRCVFEHSQGQLGRFGENLAAGTGSSYGIVQAIKSWTDEVSEYNSNNPQPSHFTQVVWKGTTQVGCAVSSCNGIFDASFGPARFFVCEYSPPGNVIGTFAQNVEA